MLSKKILYRIRFFAIISFTTLLAACGEGTGPTPVAGAPCSTDAVLSFDADSYPESAASASISLSDSCVGYKTVSVNVDNGTDTISISITLDSRGSAEPATLNFGTTDDATDTISIAEGDVITVSYTGANGVNQTDTASITETSVTLGVYSETNIDPVLNYSQITNAADLGGYVTTTTEVATDVVVPLEGNKSLQAVFETDNPLSGTYNGFAFSFIGSIGTGANDLINPSFEIPDASAGDVDCVTVADGGSSPTAVVDGWECFNGAFVASNLFKPGGPDDVQNPTAIDGSQIMKLFNADGIARQSITVAAGDNVHASVYGMNWSGDEFNNLFILQLAFFDASDTQIGVKEVTANTFDDGTLYQLEPKDGGKATDWTLMEVSEVAPAGTVRAQILQLHVLTDGTPNTGSIALDAARLYAGAYDPAPPLVDSGDIATYDRLKFAINSSAASSLMELEVKMEDAAANSASVFLSAYTPAITGDWSVYEIPLDDFGSVLDKTVITSLGFYNPSTVVNTDASYPALFAATLYFDDVHFVKKDTGPAPLTGVLIDAAVEGVTYSTATQSGITNVDGEFSYFTGEMVTFSVGGIVLGTVEGASIITPVELTGGGNPVDQAAINQLVFLQSIDEDQDPSNGITISAATRAAAAAQTLDFTLDSAAFTTAVTAVVNAITPAPGNALVSEKTALDNFYVAYTTVGGSNTFNWSFPPQDYPAFPGSASFPVDFEDAGAPYFFSDFEGGVATVVANVKPAGNASAKVAQMQKFSGQPYGGSTLTLGEIAYANGTVFSMKVWASREVPVTLKLEGANVEKIASHTGSGTWEELVFVFDGINADTGAGARAVTLIFDNGTVGDAANDADYWTFYFDDINLVSTDPAKYQLIFSDEFDGSTLDADNWTIETGYGDGGWGNNEWQNYTTDSVKVEGGNLVITADCATAPNCGVRDGSVTSGRINTLGKFSFKYGIAEARIKAPVQKAAWPAFWMLGKNYPDVGWPFAGEVDIMELFAYQSDDKTTHAAIHWCDETVVGVTPTVCFPTGWKFVTQEKSFDESLGDDFHVFSAQWNEDRIIAKIDGIEYFNQTINPATMDEFLEEFFLILNVAVGGSLGSGNQDPDGTEVWPQTMLVDYVRVYQLIAASPAETTISAEDASVIADGSTTTITVQAKDENGDDFTDGGDVALSATSASGDAILGELTDAGGGIYTATLSNLTAEQVTISGTINGAAITSGDAMVTFTPGPATPDTVSISASSTSLTAGSDATITVMVLDVNGNLTDGIVDMTVDGSATLQAQTNPSTGIYQRILSDDTAEEVTVSATLNGTAITEGNVKVTFTPGAASELTSTIVAIPDVVENDGVEVSLITVQAKDALMNNLTTGGAVVTLSTTGGTIRGAGFTPNPDGSVNAYDEGNGTYTAVISNKAVQVVTISGTINGENITGGVDPTVSFVEDPPSALTSTISVGSPPGTSAVAVADNLEEVTITVQAVGSNGVPLISGGATVVISTDDDNASATISDPVDDLGNGLYTATIKNTQAEVLTISASINGADITTAEPTVEFTPGPADVAKSTISVSESSIFADDTETSIITVQTIDLNDNLLDSDTVVVVITTDDGNGSATISNTPAIYAGGGAYTATIKNTEVETLTVSATIDGNAITTPEPSIDFTEPFSVTNTTMTVSFDTAAVVAGTNTGTVSTITVKAINGAGSDLTSSPGTLSLTPASASGNAIISTPVDALNGTYTATITNTSAEVVTISGDIDGRALAATATVTFGNTVGVSSESNIDTQLIPSASPFNEAACDQTVVLDDAVPIVTRQPFEGDISVEASSLPVSPSGSGSCVEVVVNFGASPDNTIVAYSEDFDSLVAFNDPEKTDPVASALGPFGAGYQVFADVWDGDVGTGTFKYSYGPFAAPNGGAGFSAVATNGIDLTNQYLNIYSDYNNADHADTGTVCEVTSSCNINTSVFREQTIGVPDNPDIGGVWVFSGDYRSPPTGGIAEPASTATASAFIKTLDPDDGFSTTNDERFDSTGADPEAWGSFSVEINLTDPLLAGQILQFGFGTVATNYEDSGVYYDNLNFAPRSVDITVYETLKFAIDDSEADDPLADMEVKMVDAGGNSASVFIFGVYDPVLVDDEIGSRTWKVYEIPVADFTGGGFDPTVMKSLSFRDFSSSGVVVTPLTGTLYTDDIHFIETPPAP